MQKLIDELKNDKYRTLNDKQAAQAINEKTVVVRRPLPTENVKMHAVIRGYYANVEEGCDSSNATLRKLCKNVRAWIDDPAGRFKLVDMDDPKVKQMLSGLVAFSVMLQDYVLELDSEANVTIQWVEMVGLGRVCENTIAQARREMMLDA